MNYTYDPGTATIEDEDGLIRAALCYPEDGKLMAAAPELLRACKMALERFELTSPADTAIVSILRNAIKFAEGG